MKVKSTSECQDNVHRPCYQASCNLKLIIDSIKVLNLMSFNNL